MAKPARASALRYAAGTFVRWAACGPRSRSSTCTTGEPRWSPPSARGADARLKIETWIVDFYTSRRHSANDGLPPVTVERQMIENKASVSGPAQGRCGIGPSPHFQGVRHEALLDRAEVKGLRLLPVVAGR
ncbi:hypothetical protein GCM10027161_32730 [Microbispora hainanensis]